VTVTEWAEPDHAIIVATVQQWRHHLTACANLVVDTHNIHFNSAGLNKSFNLKSRGFADSYVKLHYYRHSSVSCDTTAADDNAEISPD